MTEDLEPIPIGTYDFLPIDKVAFGPGSIETLPAEIDRLGCSRVFVIASASAAGSQSIRRIQDLTGKRLAGQFDGAEESVPGPTVVRCADAMETARADVVVTVGDSGAIDTAKAAILTAARDTGEFLPHIAVPTTISGQEFSPDFSVTDQNTGRSAAAANPFVTPSVVILDASLTGDTPRPVWLAAGAHALENAVEMVMAPNSQPATDATALEAIRLLFRHLPASVSGDQQSTARQQCQIAGWLSLFGVANITLGLSHALSREISPRYHLRHGDVAAVILPKVMAYLLRSTIPRQALIAQAAGVDTHGKAETESALEAPAAVERLLQQLGMPERLRDLDVPENDLTKLAGERDDILKVLRQAW